MFGYTTPGVYFEWQDAAARDIQPARVDIAGFVGIAERGPLHRPMRVESWNQFVSTFGRHTTQGYLAYAVQGFFTNGGRTCWVVRVADPDKAKCARLDIVAEAFGGRKLRLTASSPGTWAHRLHVTVLQLGNRFTLVLRLPDGTQEVWRDLTLNEKIAYDQDEERFVGKLLNPDESAGRAPSDPQPELLAGSRLVTAKVLDWYADGMPEPLTVDATPAIGVLKCGTDGLLTLGPEHLSGRSALANKEWGLATLEKISEISIVAIPDIMPSPFRPLRDPISRPSNCADLEPNAEQIPAPVVDDRNIGRDHPPAFRPEQILELQRELVGHCERLNNRVAILDARVEETSPQVVVEQRRREFNSKYAALYWPWLCLSNPQELVEEAGMLRKVPPSGHVAGIYARVETLVGAHKPPANELVEMVRDVTAPVDDVLHGCLNDNRVNVIRTIPGRGLRVAGARTLSSDTEWMYVNVRRLLIMIERAIDAQTQWLVFEPNNPALWSDVERVVRSFLDRLWQQGMLEGATAEQAYQVTCDETSNPTWETEAGRLITVIGVQPPWPAEFVVVRIGKTESGIEIL